MPGATGGGGEEPPGASAISVCLGAVRVACRSPHELEAARWWAAQPEASEARRCAFLAGVYVARTGLLDGLVGERAEGEAERQLLDLRDAHRRALAEQGERMQAEGRARLAAVGEQLEAARARLADECEAAAARASAAGAVELMRAAAERDGAVAELRRLRDAEGARAADLARLADARVAAAVAEAASRERAAAAGRLEDLLRANSRFAALHEAARARLDELEGARTRDEAAGAARRLDEAEARARAAEGQLEAFRRTNHGKGVVGEAMVASALRERFEHLEVEDKGGVGGCEAHCQDVWLRLGPDSFVAFESKLKKTITKADVDKFYSDLESMPGCAGAMLVSLASRNIPGKGSFAVELHAGRRPVMFVGFASPDEFARFFGDYAQVLLLLGRHAAELCGGQAPPSSGAASEPAPEEAAARERLVALVRALAPLVERARRSKNELAQLGAGLRAACRAAESLHASLDALFTDMERLVTQTRAAEGLGLGAQPGEEGTCAPPAPPAKRSPPARPRARPRARGGAPPGAGAGADAEAEAG